MKFEGVPAEIVVPAIHDAHDGLHVPGDHRDAEGPLGPCGFIAHSGYPACSTPCLHRRIVVRPVAPISRSSQPLPASSGGLLRRSSSRLRARFLLHVLASGLQAIEASHPAQRDELPFRFWSAPLETHMQRMLFRLRCEPCANRARPEHAHSLADNARSVEDALEMGRSTAVGNALCHVRNSPFSGRLHRLGRSAIGRSGGDKGSRAAIAAPVRFITVKPDLRTALTLFVLGGAVGMATSKSDAPDQCRTATVCRHFARTARIREQTIEGVKNLWTRGQSRSSIRPRRSNRLIAIHMCFLTSSSGLYQRVIVLRHLQMAISNFG